MDYNTDFNTYWQLIQPDARYNDRRDAAEREWNAHPEKQAPIIRWLQKHGAYPQRNPFFFIQDFQVRNPQRPPGQPKFLHGRELYDAMNRGVYLVQVDIPDRAEGRYPIVTKEDAERFGLKIEKDWMKKIEN